MEATRRQREVEQARHHERAAVRARRIWRESLPASPAHPYVIAKGVQRHHARQRGGSLVLPVCDLDATIRSLQFIAPDGGKLMLKGGRKRGCCIPVSGRRGAARILICEGWATGATLAEMEPAALVLAAIDAGNLRPVAIECRRRWPDAEIIVCGDADDIGRRKANEAARAAGALVAFPDIDPEVGSDFNDAARRAVA